jgi:hypothetical protein
MKYLITESQLNRAIFRYLDSQNFIKIKRNNIIYFVYSKDDEFAEIRYNKKNAICQIYLELVENVSVLFSLKDPISKEIIGAWVENTLQMDVKYTQWIVDWESEILRVD